MKRTRRKFVQSIGCGSTVALSAGCLERISPGSGEATDSTSETVSHTTTSSSSDDGAGLVITNNTGVAQSLSITVVALDSEGTVLQETVAMGTEDEEWHKSFSDVFTEYGEYEVWAETEDGESKTETATYERDQWEYWNVSITSSGIKMSGVFQ